MNRADASRDTASSLPIVNRELSRVQADGVPDGIPGVGCGDPPVTIL
jgi:hypothetical protein